MRLAASRGERIIGVLMVLAALGYLSYFVPRGWVPHDEGMIGQSAEQVLYGAIPHVDYQEAYTGGLSWLYAGLFKFAGIDLVYVRWLLFAAVSCAAFLMYAIFSRYVRPAGAALAVWVAVVWSFPNYFAGLPSWWLVICALAGFWAFIRYVETNRWRYLAGAALAAGLALVVKQTGLYVIVALVLAILYNGGMTQQRSSPGARVEQLARWGAAALSMALAALVLGPRLFRPEFVYLFCPIVACALVLLFPFEAQPEGSRSRSTLTSLASATAMAAVPLLILLIPYMKENHLRDFVYGAFVLPGKRVDFASAIMPSAVLTLGTSVPLLALVFFSSRPSVSSLAKVLLWVLAILLPYLALTNVIGYQLIWQASRAFVPAISIWICWRLASGRVEGTDRRRVMFLAAATLAWISLNQFPFAAPIYFCYVTPLAVVAAVVAANDVSALRRHTAVAWAVMLLIFGVVSANRGFINTLGFRHEPQQLDTALNLPRGHLTIRASEADVYRRLIFAIQQRLGGGELIAGPDCPEVYFLAGLLNPSGTVFDFLTADPAAPGRNEDDGPWSKGNVIVLNHEPQFSRAPSESLSARLRREFPNGEEIGHFEVRWR